MRRNRLKAKIEAGTLAVGLVHFSGISSTIDVMGAAGLDFVTIDTEHACNDVGNLQDLIRSADAAGITPIIRLTEVNRTLIQQVLDAGAGGVMISRISSPAQAVAAVQAAKYPPLGMRGSCPTVRAADFGPEVNSKYYENWSAYQETANREVLLSLLVEEKAGHEQIDQILSVPGVDIVSLGLLDTSISLGLPKDARWARWDHPVLSAALDRVIASAKEHNVYVQVSIGQPPEADPAYTASIARPGVNLLSCGSDLDILLHGCRRVVAMRPQLIAAQSTPATRGA